jgi:hypothetical protein
MIEDKNLDDAIENIDNLKKLLQELRSIIIKNNAYKKLCGEASKIVSSDPNWAEMRYKLMLAEKGEFAYGYYD